VECFEHFGSSPSKGVIRGGEYSGKAKFVTIRKKAQQWEFKDVTYLELFSENVDSEGRPDSPMGFSYCVGDRNTHASFRARTPEKNIDLFNEANRSMVEKLVRIANPEYGLIRNMYGPGGYGIPGIDDVDFDELGTAWDWRCFDKAWRSGFLGGVYPINLVGSAILSSQIEGHSLENWIKEDADRGSLRNLTNGLKMWVVSNTERAHVFRRLWESGLIFEEKRDGPTVKARIDEEHARKLLKKETTAIPDHEEKLRKRNRLIARIVAAANPEFPLVGLAEYFDGNCDEWSLAPNAVGYGRPALAQCYDILKGIREHDGVQDVLLEIQEVPDIEDPGENNTWLSSDKVLILASCSLKDLKKWTAKLNPDEVANVSAAWKHGEPPGAPRLQPGIKAYSLWWD